jgi:hypothetical protein
MQEKNGHNVFLSTDMEAGMVTGVILLHQRIAGWYYVTENIRRVPKLSG